MYNIAFICMAEDLDLTLDCSVGLVHLFSQRLDIEAKDCFCCVIGMNLYLSLCYIQEALTFMSLLLFLIAGTVSMLHLVSHHRRQSVHLTIEVLVLGDVEGVYINEVLRTIGHVDGFLK